MAKQIDAYGGQDLSDYVQALDKLGLRFSVEGIRNRPSQWNSYYQITLLDVSEPEPEPEQESDQDDLPF